MKKISIFIFSFAVLFSAFSLLATKDASAASIEEASPIIDERVKPIDTTSPIIVSPEGDQTVSPTFINDFRYRKTNVKTTYGWSSYKRISDNLNTYGSNGGSLTANTTATFGVTVSGSIDGLGISTTKTISSAKNYTLNVAADRKVYMGYRVYQKIETGTREYYDVVTGKVIRSNSYTVKTPQYGEYKLINY